MDGDENTLELLKIKNENLKKEIDILKNEYTKINDKFIENEDIYNKEIEK